MHQVVVLGAGKIGAIITHMLADSGDYEVTLADASQTQLARLANLPRVTTAQVDVTDQDALVALLTGKLAVLSAMPFQVTRHVAAAAAQAKVHYLDLTEDVETTQIVKALAADADTAFIPQCGLAPGFITIVANDLANQFDELHNVHMRVGALPQFPSNALKYNLTWSTDGLINEYCNPCEAIVEGELREVPPLEELESFSLDGVDYEAFNTSGGLGTFCETLAGRVRNLNYRTVRYPGHRDIMKMLLQDLRLKERQDLLKEILEEALPITCQDVVLVFVTVSGIREGQLVQSSYVNKIYSRELNGRLWSAIQLTTAAGICAALDLLAEGRLPQRGLVRQEDIAFADFIANRFGRIYDRAARPDASYGDIPASAA
ncbi:MAG: saccharopine dehydrogenase family protein [Pseudomonadota bacterium]